MKSSSGLDYNRNFPTHWKPEGQQAGAGPFPLSSPETHAVLKFIETKKNIVGAQDFHTYSGIILRPGVHQRDEDLPPIDLFVLKSLGQVGTDITGYPCLSIKEDFCYSKKQDVSGGFIDHLYLSLGIYTFSNEIWSVH